MQITTILGSCVAIALFDPILRVGGINHYLLPSPPQGAPTTPRYGTSAILALLEGFNRFGSQRSSLQAKVFGGANVLANVRIGHGIGQLNIETAIRSLSNLEIPIVEQNTGGNKGRRIVLDTSNFNVFHEFPADRRNASAA